jgi:hypothetical protein
MCATERSVCLAEGEDRDYGLLLMGLCTPDVDARRPSRPLIGGTSETVPPTERI